MITAKILIEYGEQSPSHLLGTAFAEVKARIGSDF